MKPTHVSKTGESAYKVKLDFWIQTSMIRIAVFDHVTIRHEEPTRSGIIDEIKRMLKWRGSDYFDSYDMGILKWQDEYPEYLKKTDVYMKLLFSDWNEEVTELNGATATEA